MWSFNKNRRLQFLETFTSAHERRHVTSIRELLGDRTLIVGTLEVN